MVMDLLVSGVAVLIGDAIGLTGHFRKIERDARRGVYVSGLRVVSGVQPGLSAQWRIGPCQIESGAMTLDGVAVRVLDIVDESARRVPPGESLAGGSPTTGVLLKTASARLEWTTLTRHHRAACERLFPSGSDASPPLSLPPR